MKEEAGGMRLCPNCANSIANDATNCRYCKSDLSSEHAPEWLRRASRSANPVSGGRLVRRFSLPRGSWRAGAVLLAVLVAFFAGRYVQGTTQSASGEATAHELEAKEEIIRSQEAQITETSQQLDATTRQLAEMKTQLEAAQAELSALHSRAAAVRRPPERQNGNGSSAATARSRRDPDAGIPAAGVQTAATTPYETTRATSVHEAPSPSSRVITRIEPRTRINVASAAAGWLEIRSRRGNPPGYVRADDARPIGTL